MTSSDRRTFLKAAGSTLMAAPLFSASRLSPNDRLRIAIVGLRGRGRDHIKGFGGLGAENVDLVSMCDVDENLLHERAKAYEQSSGRKVQTVTDMRRILDDKDIHAVAFATPNHWHALATVWACQAGKDVYVEKPGTQVFSEGLKVMEAAAKYKRVVSHGTQNRSSPNIVEAIRKLKEGVIGRVYIARSVAFKTRNSFGRITSDPAPAGLNWDAWLGPAKKVAYSRKIQGSSGNGWHLLWEYGNGEIGNQGVHELDIMRWGLGIDSLPSRVSSMGGKYLHPDDEQDAPQSQTIQYEFAGRDVMVTFETRSGFTNTEAGMGAEYPFLDKQNVVGVIFIGTEGYMIIPDYSSYHTFLGRKREKGPFALGANDITDLPHMRNFIAAVRSGKPEDVNAGPRDLHVSSAMAHFANISWRTRRMLHWDDQSGRFKGDEEANGMLTRQYRAPYTMPSSV